MTNITYNFSIFQGADFEFSVELRDASNNPRNLTGKSFRGMARRRIEDPKPAFELSFEEISLAAGTFKVKISSEDTEQLTDRRKVKFVYDVEMFDEDAVERVLMGEITMIPEVTR